MNAATIGTATARISSGGDGILRVRLHAAETAAPARLRGAVP